MKKGLSSQEAEMSKKCEELCSLDKCEHTHKKGLFNYYCAFRNSEEFNLSEKRKEIISSINNNTDFRYSIDEWTAHTILDAVEEQDKKLKELLKEEVRKAHCGRGITKPIVQKLYKRIDKIFGEYKNER